MKAKFEKAFLKDIKKHAGIKKHIEQKVRQIMEHPVEFGEPLKGNLRGFYSVCHLDFDVSLRFSR